ALYCARELRTVDNDRGSRGWKNSILFNTTLALIYSLGDTQNILGISCRFGEMKMILYIDVRLFEACFVKNIFQICRQLRKRQGKRKRCADIMCVVCGLTLAYSKLEDSAGSKN